MNAFKRWHGGLAAVTVCVFHTASNGQITVVRSVIAGGGGTSSGPTFTVMGTIGQHDAGVELAGGGYTLSGGFWPATGAIGPHCGSSDYNCDGDFGTDADIEAFFACLGGACPVSPCPSTSDFNGDGDFGTDSDIEAFFRVLGGGTC